MKREVVFRKKRSFLGTLLVDKPEYIYFRRQPYTLYFKRQSVQVSWKTAAKQKSILIHATSCHGKLRSAAAAYQSLRNKAHLLFLTEISFRLLSNFW